MSQRIPEDEAARRQRAKAKLTSHRGLATMGEKLVPLGDFRTAVASHGVVLDAAARAEALAHYRTPAPDGITLEGPYSRIAVFGGVYSNRQGLEAVLADARRRGADAVYCLGDLGGFGPEPERIWPLLVDGDVQVIQGNYEASLAGGADDCNCGYADPRDNHYAGLSYRYTAEHCSPAFKAWMGERPTRRRVQVGERTLLMVHGSPRRINEFLFASTAPDPFLTLLLEQNQCDGILCTHTGLHWHRALPSGGDVVNVGVIGPAGQRRSHGDLVHHARHGRRRPAWRRADSPGLRPSRAGRRHASRVVAGSVHRNRAEWMVDHLPRGPTRTRAVNISLLNGSRMSTTDQQPTTDIAILGAGPAGLEAALAATEAGRDFLLFEAGATVAGQIERWRHVRLFTPWSMNVSPRMREALTAIGQPPPDDDRCPTGGDLIDHVLGPIGALPGIAQSLRLSTAAERVGRMGLLKHQAIGAPERGQALFRLLVRDRHDNEEIVTARVVLDCTGNVFPTHLGDGGIPALGEEAALIAGHIEHTIPDLHAEPERWRGRRVLLVGAGHSAQTIARDFARFTKESPSTRVTWSVRNPTPTWTAVADDPLPDRAALAAFAAGVAAAPDRGPIRLLPGTIIDRIEINEGGTSPLSVTLRNADGTPSVVEADTLLALTGRTGDDRLYRQLQVHECYATSGPMKLAAALLGASGASGDCLAQQSHGPDTLRNPEPGFFILGSKSYGRRNDYLLRVGWQQVDDVFSLLDHP